MAETYYAWTPIITGREEEGGRFTTVAIGEKVTKASLKVSDEDWNELLEAGSVRPRPYPDMEDTFQGSPRDWYLQQAREAEEVFAPEPGSTEASSVLETFEPVPAEATPEESK